jgi:hypothetical protein
LPSVTVDLSTGFQIGRDDLGADYNGTTWIFHFPGFRMKHSVRRWAAPPGSAEHRGATKTGNPSCQAVNPQPVIAYESKIQVTG